MPTTNRRVNQGKSITRPSIKNSFKYRRTSGTDGESGEPRLTNKIALLTPEILVIESPYPQIRFNAANHRLKNIFLCASVSLWLNSQPFNDVHTRNNRITQRNPIAIMPGKEKAR